MWKADILSRRNQVLQVCLEVCWLKLEVEDFVLVPIEAPTHREPGGGWMRPCSQDRSNPWITKRQQRKRRVRWLGALGIVSVCITKNNRNMRCLNLWIVRDAIQLKVFLQLDRKRGNCTWDNVSAGSAEKKRYHRLTCALWWQCSPGCIVVVCQRTITISIVPGSKNQRVLFLVSLEITLSQGYGDDDGDGD